MVKLNGQGWFAWSIDFRGGDSRWGRSRFGPLPASGLLLLAVVGIRFAPPGVAQPLPEVPVPAELPPPSDPGGVPTFEVPPAPPPGLPPLPSSQRYVVYIPGNNPIALAEVQLIEPEAFVKELQGRTVIQAGVFVNRDNAYRRARELERLVGIRSAIATVEDVPPAVATAFPPAATPPISANLTTFGIPGGYFVVIPANPQDFPRITNELIEAGMNPAEISSRSVPFGPHLAIGPFPDAVTARQESGYLKGFGLDARVYEYDR